MNYYRVTCNTINEACYSCESPEKAAQLFIEDSHNGRQVNFGTYDLKVWVLENEFFVSCGIYKTTLKPLTTVEKI